MRKHLCFIAVFFFLWLLIGCSGNDKRGTDVLSPSMESNQEMELPIFDAEQQISNRNLIGIWDVNIDTKNGSYEIFPSRELLSTHIKAGSNLASLYMSLIQYDPVKQTVIIRFSIKNLTSFPVYDVRLIILIDNFGHRLLNPDDWTPLWDISPGMKINPFRAYAKGTPSRRFPPYGTMSEDFEIYCPGQNVKFTAVIDACWPSNCSEPYEISEFAHDEIYDFKGSAANASVKVLDWQNDANEVYLFCPQITGVSLLPFSQASSEIWSTVILNNTGASEGKYVGYIIARSTNTSPIALYEEVTIQVGHIITMKPENPRILYSLNVGGICSDVDVDGNFAYATVDKVGLKIINIQDPEAAYIVKSVPAAGFAKAISVENGYAYVAAGTTGLVIFDVDPPEMARMVKVVDTPGSANGVSVLGGYAYVADGSYGLQIIDVDPIPSSYIVKTVDTPSDAQSVVVTTDYAYVADGYSGLQVIDIFPINTAGIVGSADTDGFAIGIDKWMNEVYIADFIMGIYKVDVTNPLNPFLSTFIESRKSVDIEISFGYSFVAAAEYGLQIFDNNASIHYSSLDTNGIAQGLAIAPPYLFLSDGAGKLKIIRLWSDSQRAPIYHRCGTWGGAGVDSANDVVSDYEGNFYVTGSYEGMVDFDPGSGEDWHTSLNGKDVYISKFGPYGEHLWTITFPGMGIWDEGHGLAIDVFNNVYVIGEFTDTIDLDAGPDTFFVTSKGGKDIFGCKYSSNGKFLGCRVVGGIGDDVGLDIVTDNQCYVYATGYFQDVVDFDPDAGVDLHHSEGGNDIFIAKFDSSGNYDWARTWGSPNPDDLGTAIALFDKYNIFVTGMVNGDLFVQKYNTKGIRLQDIVWYSDGVQIGHDIKCGNRGEIYITGGFEGNVDFDPGGGVDIRTSYNGRDIFLIKMTINCNYQWSSTWGGMGIWDEGHGLLIDRSGDVIMVGTYEDVVDFDPQTGEDWYTSKGGKDVFISKYTMGGEYKWSRTWGGMGIWDEGHGLAVNYLGDIFISGVFGGSVDFNPTVDIDERKSNGETDSFIVRYSQ